MPESKKLPSLKELEEKLAKFREQKEPGKLEQPSRQNALSAAFNICLEFASPVAVGGLLGYFLDKWLGTLPFLFIVLLLLGAVAGGIAIVKIAKKMDANTKKGKEQ